MKHKKQLITALLLMIVFSSSYAGKIAIFNTDIAEDATPAVLKRLLNADENPISEIKFEKGTYHFYPEKGLEKYVHISNHCDVMVHTAFPLQGFENLKIDGQGSTFIFHGIMIPFLVNDSKNITIENLSIDWNEPFHSEGKIVAIDEVNKTFDMSIGEEYPYEIRNGQLIFIKPYYEHTIGQSILYDPVRKAIMFDTESYTNISTIRKAEVSRNVDKVPYKYERDPRAVEFKRLGRENKVTATELKPGLIRIAGHSKKLPPVGMILTMKGDQGFNRVAPAFRVTHTYGFNAKNINVHHAGGMGMIAENSADLILDNFNVTPSQGRMVSTTADATHFVGCRGKIELKNCTFENQLDDASNIHGTYQIITDLLEDNKIGVRMGHDQQKGFQVGIPSDTLGLVRLKDSFHAYDYVTIKSIQYMNGRYQIITLNEHLPKGVQYGDLIENVSAYPELLVQNCKIQNNRARGLLLSTPKKTIIEDNYFSTEMEALLIPVESSHWYESGNGANVIIRNNVFQDCTHSGQNRGVIRFHTDDENANIAFKNFEISNNTFNHWDSWILQISNIDGLKVEGNTFNYSGTFPQKYPDEAAIQIEHSKNVSFKKNTFKGAAKTILETDDNLSKLNFK